MTVLSEIDTVEHFKVLPFYNKSFEKRKIKHLTDLNLLAELPFRKQLIVTKLNQAFSGYAMTYKVEIVERKDLILQLEASKLSIKDLFDDFLNELKGFEYEITAKVLLKKYKPNEEIEFAPVLF